MEKQPGEVLFITGLRHDLFGISCSNLNTNFLFVLPQVQLSNTKDSNSRLSMIFSIIKTLKENASTKKIRKLVLLADNCSGQNKDRYTLWSLSWLVALVYFDQV